MESPDAHSSQPPQVGPQEHFLRQLAGLLAHAAKQGLLGSGFGSSSDVGMLDGNSVMSSLKDGLLTLTGDGVGDCVFEGGPVSSGSWGVDTGNRAHSEHPAHRRIHRHFAFHGAGSVAHIDLQLSTCFEGSSPIISLLVIVDDVAEDVDVDVVLLAGIDAT